MTNWYDIPDPIIQKNTGCLYKIFWNLEKIESGTGSIITHSSSTGDEGRGVSSPLSGELKYSLYPSSIDDPSKNSGTNSLGCEAQGDSELCSWIGKSRGMGSCDIRFSTQKKGDGPVYPLRAYKDSNFKSRIKLPINLIGELIQGIEGITSPKILVPWYQLTGIQRICQIGNIPNLKNIPKGVPSITGQSVKDNGNKGPTTITISFQLSTIEEETTIP